MGCSAGVWTGTALGRPAGDGSPGLGLGFAAQQGGGAGLSPWASPWRLGGLCPHPPSVTPVPRSLPEAEAGVENDSFEVAESQALMSRLQWDGSSDISPSDSASSKASECSGAGGHVGGTDPSEGQILRHRSLCGNKTGCSGMSSVQEGLNRPWLQSLEHLVPHLGGAGTFWGTFSWVLTRVGHHPLCFGAHLLPDTPISSLSPVPRYKQLRVPQDQEEEAPPGAGERRPRARLQQEEEAQAPRPPHPQHLR